MFLIKINIISIFYPYIYIYVYILMKNINEEKLIKNILPIKNNNK